MADPNAPPGSCCCTPPTPGLRILTFPDGVQAGVFGLDETFAEVYSEGMLVTPDTASEIVERLAVRNYIAPSVRQRYCDLLIGEYEKYAQSSKRSDEKQKSVSDRTVAGRKPSFLSRLFGPRASTDGEKCGGKRTKSLEHYSREEFLWLKTLSFTARIPDLSVCRLGQPTVTGQSLSTSRGTRRS